MLCFADLHVEIFSEDVRRSYGNIHRSRRVEVPDGKIIQIIGVSHDLQCFASLFIKQLKWFEDVGVTVQFKAKC